MLISCREKLDDNLNYSDEDVLVVEGEINDLPGPYSIKLTKSVSFNSNEKVNVNNAEVYVTDNLNNRYDFKETYPGIYFSISTEFQGKTGGTYTLHINTNDGLKYESTPCTIGLPCRVDSIYRSSYSEYGLQVSGNISFASDQNVSLKIDAEIATENVIDSIYLPTYVSVHDEYHYFTKYYTTKHLNSNPVLKTNTDYVKGSSIKNLPLFNYNFQLLQEQTKTYDDLNIVRLSSGKKNILIINVSTISNDAFNFYNNLLAQTGGRDVFFEPLPVQLKGNISCINDNSKKVYGLFQANSVVKNYYKVDNERFFLTRVNGIPPITHDSLKCELFCGTVILTHLKTMHNNLDSVSNALVYLIDDSKELRIFNETRPGIYLGCGHIDMFGSCYFCDKDEEEGREKVYIMHIYTND
jgi:hypothetical protein